MNRLLRWINFWRVVAAVSIVAGLYATVIRFTSGLEATTALSDEMPWGLWTGFKLIGVGLAAGGFTITAAVHLLDLRHLRPIVRSAVLTAFLGYLTFIALLIFDLGLPYRIWHPLVMWNPHSVMFEVAWCVMLYTTVLALEFAPMVLERFGMHTSAERLHRYSVPLVIAGVLLSTLHQSSLGTLFVIVPEKLHGFWYSPLLPVFFFLSAIAAGLCMVILESFMSERIVGRPLRTEVLNDIGRVVVVVLALYMVIKLQDMHARGTLGLLTIPGPTRMLFLTEMGFGVVIPGILLSLSRFREDRTGLTGASLMVVLGFVLNRLNVAVTGFQSRMDVEYFPSLREVAIVAMLIAMVFTAFSVAVRHLKIFPPGESNPWAATRGVKGVTHASLVLLAILLVYNGLVFQRAEAERIDHIPAEGSTRATDVGARPLTSLPDDILMGIGEDSPGPVTFSHESHVEGPECLTCHAPGGASILRAGGPRLSAGEAAHAEDRCGRCHNGTDAFSIDDTCEGCHVVD